MKQENIGKRILETEAVFLYLEPSKTPKRFKMNIQDQFARKV